jgi:hypothetical protein
MDTKSQYLKKKLAIFIDEGLQLMKLAKFEARFFFYEIDKFCNGSSHSINSNKEYGCK